MRNISVLQTVDLLVGDGASLVDRALEVVRMSDNVI